MFQRICDSLNTNTSSLWLLFNSDSSEVFDDLAMINSFHVIVWSNTSGASGLTSMQRQNYEQYVLNGGNYIGIHAASDTYRHSSSNGNNTGTWDFYAEYLSGCSVQENPNHTVANYSGVISYNANHPIQNGIPNPWNKNEEYYYWENGFLENTFTKLLEVEETGTNSYDSSRMVAQYKVHNWGSKSLYTPDIPTSSVGAISNSVYKDIPSTYANQYYKQFIPYLNQGSAEFPDQPKSELLEKLNYIIDLLEDQQDYKTNSIFEDLILYAFLGIFVIFIVDSFAKSGKYVR
jgi:hypothetical protein